MAFLTYLIQPDDIVWQFVKDRAEPQTLERILFIVATLLIGAGAALCTWARARSGEVRNSAPRLLFGRWWYLGEFIYAIGLGSLAPPWGFVILVLGEALRLTRLIGRESGNVENLRPGATTIPRWVVVAQRNGAGTMWGMAFWREIVKWAILISMIVFVITLKDRVVETLLVTSFLLGLLLNSRLFGVFSSAESA